MRARTSFLPKPTCAPSSGSPRVLARPDTVRPVLPPHNAPAFLRACLRAFLPPSPPSRALSQLACCHWLAASVRRGGGRGWTERLCGEWCVCRSVRRAIADGTTVNFRRALHESVSTTLDEGADEVWVNGALQTGEGWMHINGTHARSCLVQARRADMSGVP
jgi:hypothetical protein